MKQTLSLLTLALAAITLNAAAAGTDPLDFDYEIAGNVLERPALVFNDGSDDVFSAARGPRRCASMAVTVRVRTSSSQAHRRVIHYTAGWLKRDRILEESQPLYRRQGSAATICRSDFAGFSDRLALIGARSSLESTRPLSATLPLVATGEGAGAARLDRFGAKRRRSHHVGSFATRDGENWMQSLDRLVGSIRPVRRRRLQRPSREPCVAAARSSRLAVNYVAPAAPAGTVARLAVGRSRPDRRDCNEKHRMRAAPAESVLAAKFGALAIRDGDDSHIQIKFAAKTRERTEDRRPRTVQVAQAEMGRRRRNVVTFNRARSASSSPDAHRQGGSRARGGHRVRVRLAKQAALESVFDKEGSTFFKFADTVGNVTVADVAHIGSGEQKGRYYKFNGTADQFIVNADGNVVNVMRKHEVRFFDRPAS